jgi:Pectate lyase superfamily protein
MTTPHQPINAVADFGADPTGTADSAAAIQAAMNRAGTLGAGGGAVYLPPGVYSIASASLVPVTGVRLFGDTRGGTRLKAAAVSMWNMGPAATVTNFELDHLLLTASTVDIFHGANIERSSFHDNQFQQNSASHSIWNSSAGPGLMVECWFERNIHSLHGAPRTVEAWLLLAPQNSNQVNANVWRNEVVFNNDGDTARYVFHIVGAGAAPVNDGNIFDNIAFENPLGGAIWLESCRGSEIANCLAWDVAGVIANSLFKATKNASGGASTNNTFRNSGHVNGSFAAGASDIQLDGACTDTLILHPRPAAASIDLGGSAGTDIVGVTSAAVIRNSGASLGAKYLGGPTVAYPAGVQADDTSATVTGAAFASLTRAWPVAAQEEATGTVYKLTASGRGGWGSVPAQLNFRWLLLGAAGAVPIAAAAFPAGQAFSWALTALVRVTATGAAGTCDTVVQGCLSASGGTFTAASSVPVVVTSTGTALDSTAAHTFALQARWLAGGTGGTITCDGSVFERAGA